MMGRTHALAGLASLWTLRVWPGALTPENAAPLVVLGVLGALLPDLDAADSLLKRAKVGGIAPAVPFAVLLHSSLGHRGATHSLLGLAVAFFIALPLAFIFGLAAPVALALGYLSHLLCDGSTKSGIPLFYVPVFYPHKQRWHLLPQPLRLTTGSPAENIVFVLFALLALGLLLSVLWQDISIQGESSQNAPLDFTTFSDFSAFPETQE